MAEQNVRWPQDATQLTDAEITPDTPLMAADNADDEKLSYITHSQLAESVGKIVEINGIEVKPIAGGATEATAVVLPAGPAGENRKMSNVTGWFKNSASGTPWEAKAENLNVNWWDGTTWSLGSSVPLPTIDTSTLVAKTDFNELESDLYGSVVPLYLKAKENVSVNPDVIGTGTSTYVLGMATTGLWNTPQIIPPGTYTVYVVLNVTTKGQMYDFSYWRQVTQLGSIPASSIPLNQDFGFVFPFVVTTQINANALAAQLRTRYPKDSTLPASLIVKTWNIYQGAHTLQEIEDSQNPIDKSKVLASKKADTSDYATVAGTVEELPEKYVTKVESEADKITGKFVPNKIQNYTDTTGSTSVINYVDDEGLLHVGGAAPTGQRLWFGIDFPPAGYATVSKNYVIVLKGKVKGVGIRNLLYNRVSGPSNIIAQDLVDNVFSSFEVAVELSYSAGTSNTSRYTYITNENISGATSASYEAIFEVFSVFERIEGFSLQDYISAAKGEYESFNDDLMPNSVASKDYVQEVVGGIQVSKYSQEDYKPKYDVEMLLEYAQSNGLAGNASNSTSDFANSITFSSSGTNINSTTGTANFIPVANAVTFSPISASAVTIVQLLKSENKVELAKFGNSYLLGAAGLSGGSITAMNKGTDPYTYFINAVTRAKTLCDSQGKTFGIRAIYWTQGEGDRAKTKQQYYDLLKQMFIDLNTDIKAITGQTDDVIFFTYQTSAWKGVQNTDGNYYQLGVQNAQVQLARDLPNVFVGMAMYQFGYVDEYHPLDRAVVGISRAVGYKRVIVDGEDWPIFQPISHQIVGNFLHLKITAPVLPIRFDVSGDPWHNPNGKQSNFGFKVLKSGVDIISAEPFITKGNTVIIPCSSSPLGATVEYAVNGHFGGGNLCDSQSITIRNKNIDYKTDNFCISFDDYIVN